MVEVEVKFLIGDVAGMRRKLEAVGGASQGRVFESNLVYEDPEGRFAEQGMLLRLRRDREVRLTVKKPSAQAEEGFKTMDELEVSLNDFETMHRLLEALSYRTRLRYEKWRETYRLGEVLACVDTLPFGDFLELESEEAHTLRSAADRLGLPWHRRIVCNYHRIFQEIRSTHGLSFSDITFDRFEGHAIDLERVRPRIEAGTPD